MARFLCGGRALVGIAGFAAFLFAVSLATADEPQFTIQVEVAGGAGAAVDYGPPSHLQTKYIFLANGPAGLKLASFCVLKDGKIAAVLDRGEEAHGGGGILSGIITAIASGEQPTEQAPASDTLAAKAGQAAKSIAELRILDADGKTLNKYPLDFHAQTINVCPDGNLIIGGDGMLTRYDLKGKELARAESPHVAAAKKDPDESPKPTQAKR